MPSPITFPLTPWLRWALWGAVVGWDIGQSLVDQSAEDIGDVEWRRLQVVWNRGTPAGTSEDVAICTFDLMNWTDGQVDSSWITADYTTAEARFNTFFGSYLARVADEVVLKEYRWYRARFAESMTSAHRFEDSGPPVRITTRNVAGTNASAAPLPYQVALSVTEKTPWPKHWGRFYLPGLTADQVTTNGRFSGVTTGAIATAAGTLYAGLSTDQLPIIVPVTQIDGVLGRSWTSVTQIQVDDIPDVQRRRRPKQASVRSLSP